MAFESNNNHGRACQLNLNETYYERVLSQPSIQLSQQIPTLEQSEIFPHNMDNESVTQLGADVGNDTNGKPSHVIPNQQRYRGLLKAS